jgi:hypothetical protein
VSHDQHRIASVLRDIAVRLEKLDDPDGELDYEDLDNKVEELEEELMVLEQSGMEDDEDEDEDAA